MIIACSQAHISYSQPNYGAHIMRIDQDHQIWSNQLPVRVLSLSPPRFQDPQRTSNCASIGVCPPSQLSGTAEITKKASTSCVEFNIEFKGNSRTGALKRWSALGPLLNQVYFRVQFWSPIFGPMQKQTPGSCFKFNNNECFFCLSMRPIFSGLFPILKQPQKAVRCGAPDCSGLPRRGHDHTRQHCPNRLTGLTNKAQKKERSIRSNLPKAIKM